MTLKKIFKNQAIGIILIQIFSKITGIFREIILANFFGGSMLFADYLKLMTYGQLVAIFCTEGGLGGNLMKKFSLMHKRNLSFSKVRKQSLNIAVLVFIIVGLLQLFAWKFVLITDYNFTLVIIISALTSSIVFYFNVGQIILLSSSNYSNLYKSNFFRSFIYLVLLYPLLFLFNILGAPLNRFISVLSQYFNTWKIVNKKINANSKSRSLGYSTRDFNIWVFLTNNSIFVWYVLLRIYFSFISGVDIIYLTYGFILASSFDGIIIKSFSTYLLERNVNVKISIKKTFLLVLLICVLAILGALILGPYIIKLIFGSAGSFTNDQLQNIYYYFIVLLFLVCANGLCNLVFQKVFSGRRKVQFKQSKYYILISMITFVLISAFSLFNDFRLEYLIMIALGFSVVNFIYIIKLLKDESAF